MTTTTITTIFLGCDSIKINLVVVVVHIVLHKSCEHKWPTEHLLTFATQLIGSQNLETWLGKTFLVLRWLVKICESYLCSMQVNKETLNLIPILNNCQNPNLTSTQRLGLT